MSIHLPNRFEGKAALVTGGAGGIGLAVAERLANEGARVVLADINKAGVEQAAAGLAAKGLQVSGIHCDQTQAEEVSALMEQAFPDGIDLCFANAGWGNTELFLDVQPETLRKVLDINVVGTFIVCQAAARSMVAHRRGGSIVITSSSGATESAAFFSAYGAAKAALNMLTQTMALELGSYDIRVNAVMPGVTATGMTGGLLSRSKIEQALVYDTPLGRVGKPEDIANVVSFLMSADASFVTGRALMVDGGGSLNGPNWFSNDFRVRGDASWQLNYKRYGWGGGSSNGNKE